MKKFKIQVFQHGPVGADDEHIVQVDITEGTQKIGEFHLPGGTYENAKAIGEGLIELADSGFDLSEFVLDTSAEVEG